jgi:hypothetical protein
MILIIFSRITAELSDGTSLRNAKGVHCRRCDMRSSDLMGGGFFFIMSFFLIYSRPAKSWTERKLSSADGRDGYKLFIFIRYI